MRFLPTADLRSRADQPQRLEGPEWMPGEAVLALLLACAGPAAAATGDYVNMPLSVRQAGMGSVVAGPGDVLGAWSNPAVLGFQEAPVALSAGGASLSAGDATAMGAAASAMIMPGVALAGLLSGFNAKEPKAGEPGDSFGPRVWSGGLAFAFRAGDPLSAGVTVKSVSDRNAAGPVSTGAWDAGLEASFDGFRGGIAIRNMGSPVLSGSGPFPGRDRLAGETHLDAAYAYRTLVAGIAFSKLDGADPRVGAGAEWWPVAAVGVRAGVSGSSGTTEVAAGLSAVFHGAGLDYAFGNNPAGNSHRLALSYLFGGAPVTPAPARKPAEPVAPAPKPAEPVVPAPAVPKPAAVAPVAAKPVPPPNPAEIEADYQSAKALIRANLHADARKKLESIVARDPANWKSWALLGNACYGAADKPAAMTAWSKSLELNPDNPQLKSWVEKLQKQ